MSLQITDLHKSFDGQVALERIHLAVGASEFVCLLGPSGCGKTTLLRIIAGLLPADGGRITLGGRDLATLPARDRTSPAAVTTSKDTTLSQARPYWRASQPIPPPSE